MGLGVGLAVAGGAEGIGVGTATVGTGAPCVVTVAEAAEVGIDAGAGAGADFRVGGTVVDFGMTAVVVTRRNAVGVVVDLPGAVGTGEELVARGATGSRAAV